MSKKTVYFLLALVICYSFIVRIFNIRLNPPSLFSDEIRGFVSAKKILETDSDINGKLNIYFYNRLEYFPPIYGYLTYFSSFFFTDKTIAIRFPAVVAGSLSVLTIFILSQMLFSNYTSSLISATVAAFMPWLIYLSRIGWEPSLLILPILSGIIFFLMFVQRKKELFFYISTSIFGLSLYTYRASEFLAPFFMITMIVLYWGVIKNKFKAIIIGLTIFFIVAIPFIHISLNEPLMHERSNRIFTFADGVNTKSLKTFANNYAAHFSPDFLFINTDNNMGRYAGKYEMFMSTLPFILLGIFTSLKNFNKPEYRFLLIWLTVYPLGGSLTNDGVPHATRTLIGAPLFAIFVGIGFAHVMTKWPKLSKVILILTSITFIWEFSRFVPSYFKNYPSDCLFSCEYGQRQIFDYISKNKNNYKRVCLDNMNYWNEQTFKYFYDITSGINLINGTNESDCLKEKSLIVNYSDRAYPEGINKIYEIRDPHGQIFWSFYEVVKDHSPL